MLAHCALKIGVKQYYGKPHRKLNDKATRCVCSNFKVKDLFEYPNDLKYLNGTLAFHILQLVISLSFYTLKPEKDTPSRRSLPAAGIIVPSRTDGNQNLIQYTLFPWIIVCYYSLFVLCIWQTKDGGVFDKTTPSLCCGTHANCSSCQYRSLRKEG